ncbi:hypothetical protein DUNSADRAFT_17928 [Dunaliella salina]|uniref:Encoded protein n=1 Tax=Dunaliella salina TaxID=3046 RepID=A0ABQ7H946_DUNSA|nr:hypothetical protein DUNSADRAFT_17928 [Dunaliella salina]|eukprot:KAF5843350.1 hypothetical protein DUNSADRAFT_17928 [Dunaliella salina]
MSQHQQVLQRARPRLRRRQPPPPSQLWRTLWPRTARMLPRGTPNTARAHAQQVSHVPANPCWSSPAQTGNPHVHLVRRVPRNAWGSFAQNGTPNTARAYTQQVSHVPANSCWSSPAEPGAPLAHLVRCGPPTSWASFAQSGLPTSSDLCATSEPSTSLGSLSCSALSGIHP